jgi:hypothetical protein
VEDENLLYICCDPGIRVGLSYYFGAESLALALEKEGDHTTLLALRKARESKTVAVEAVPPAVKARYQLSRIPSLSVRGS